MTEKEFLDKISDLIDEYDNSSSTYVWVEVCFGDDEANSPTWKGGTALNWHRIPMKEKRNV